VALGWTLACAGSNVPSGGLRLSAGRWSFAPYRRRRNATRTTPDVIRIGDVRCRSLCPDARAVAEITLRFRHRN
jgi:hypothetical protein